MTPRIEAVYRVRAAAADIAARAQGIAVEQSVEMPLGAITQDSVLREVVGDVRDIADLGGGVFEVRIGLAAETVGEDAGQLVAPDALGEPPVEEARSGDGHFSYIR